MQYILLRHLSAVKPHRLYSHMWCEEVMYVTFSAHTIARGPTCLTLIQTPLQLSASFPTPPPTLLALPNVLFPCKPPPPPPTPIHTHHTLPPLLF